MKRVRSIFYVLVAVSFLSLVSCSRDKQGDTTIDRLSNAVILEWDEIAFKAFDGPLYQHSLMASRINAMTHLAMHDALNAIEAKYATYAFNGKDSGADPVVAAAVAAHTVLLHELPAKEGYIDSALQNTLAAITDSDARSRGILLGKQAAQAIIANRNNDGSAGDPIGAIPPSAIAGVYQPVPPFNFVFAQHWENLKLFALQSKQQFRPVPHPAINSPVYATDFAEVKETGKSNSATRTADQTAYTKFWYEFSEATWNRVARVVAANKKLGLLETARLFALVDIALADAYTAGWDAKFHYNFWRPYTAIRNAGNDGVDATVPDTNWEPGEATPPVQDYPSTHSALGNAGATVLARLLGDNTTFTLSTFTAAPQGSSRTFTSFSQAANENADSRVRAGIHFRFSCLAGQDMGNKIGNWVVDNCLRKL